MKNHNMNIDLAVMRETLRLAATAPMRSVAPMEDTTIGGGKYAIPKDTSIVIQTWELHRDPAIWGDDVCAVFFFFQTSGYRFIVP